MGRLYLTFCQNFVKSYNILRQLRYKDLENAVLFKKYCYLLNLILMRILKSTSIDNLQRLL